MLLIVGVPYAVALGLVVAIFDLIPLAGATIAGIVVVTVAFLHSVPAGIVAAVFIIVYQHAGAVQVVVRDQLSARGKLNRAAGRP